MVCGEEDNSGYNNYFGKGMIQYCEVSGSVYYILKSIASYKALVIFPLNTMISLLNRTCVRIMLVKLIQYMEHALARCFTFGCVFKALVARVYCIWFLNSPIDFLLLATVLFTQVALVLFSLYLLENNRKSMC